MTQIKKQKARRLEDILFNLKWRFNHVHGTFNHGNTTKKQFNALAGREQKTLRVLMQHVEKQLISATAPVLVLV